VARRWLAPALGGTNPHIFIETDRGTLEIELLPAEAPLTVAAFINLVDRRYFDGTRWHRVVPNFVVQDGDPRGDGWGGPGGGFVLRDEINPLRYQTGASGWRCRGRTPAAANTSSRIRRSRTRWHVYDLRSADGRQHRAGCDRAGRSDQEHS